MNCLNESLTVEFVRGNLASTVAQSVGLHIDECSLCRRLVAVAADSSMMSWSSSLQRTVAPTAGLIQEDRSTEPGFDADLTDPVCSDARLALEDLQVGELVDGRFRLRQKLGQGAMGQVYAAYDERLKVQVAIKMLQPRLANNRVYLKQLHHEIVVARRVSHPNACRVYDLGHAGPLHFISMELIEGETLEARMTHGPITRVELIAILLQIAGALDAAHREGVVHRDLKPSNVMIDEQGHITVMDFGLARDMLADSTGPHGAIGTPAFWSPEQGRGDPATPASDLYSLGVMACRMFARAAGAASGDRLASVPAPYRDVVARCLEPDPQKRPISAEGVRAELQAARRREEGRARRVALSAVALAALTLGVAGWAVHAPRRGNASSLERASRGELTEISTRTPEAHPPQDTVADPVAGESANAFEIDADGDTTLVSAPVTLTATAQASAAISPSPVRPSSPSVPAAQPAARPLALPAGRSDAVGYLTFDTYPWTTVSENGQILGTTPLVHVALPAGPHTLTLENPGQRMQKTYSVTIKEGDTFKRRLGFK
jgi:predicted anti-sigma-YlaC factor YlaD